MDKLTRDESTYATIDCESGLVWYIGVASSPAEACRNGDYENGGSHGSGEYEDYACSEEYETYDINAGGFFVYEIADNLINDDREPDDNALISDIKNGCFCGYYTDYYNEETADEDDSEFYAFVYLDGTGTTWGDPPRAAGDLYSFSSESDRDAFVDGPHPARNPNSPDRICHAVEPDSLPYRWKTAEATYVE